MTPSCDVCIVVADMNLSTESWCDVSAYESTWALFLSSRSNAAALIFAFVSSDRFIPVIFSFMRAFVASLCFFGPYPPAASCLSDIPFFCSSVCVLPVSVTEIFSRVSCGITLPVFATDNFLFTSSVRGFPNIGFDLPGNDPPSPPSVLFLRIPVPISFLPHQRISRLSIANEPTSVRLVSSRIMRDRTGRCMEACFS